MELRMGDLTELSELHKLVTGASLTDEAKNSTLWCLGKMPKLYADFRRTDESRYLEAIAGFARAVLKRMSEKDAGEDAGKVAEAAVGRLGEMHRRLGMAPLGIKIVTATAKGRGKKAG
jgi:hypothetical protein